MFCLLCVSYCVPIIYQYFSFISSLQKGRIFHGVTKRLQYASSDGFIHFQHPCEVEYKLYSADFPDVIVISQASKFQGLRKHSYSNSLLPPEYETLTALEVRGGGNCL